MKGPHDPRRIAGAACIVAALAGSCSTDGVGDRDRALVIRPEATLRVGPAGEGSWILPNGRRIEPVGQLVPVDPMPLGLELTPDGRTLFTSSDGDGRQTVAAIDTATGQVLSTVQLRALFVGLAISSSGKTLYVSSGGDERIAVFDWDGATLSERGAFPLSGYAGDLALSPDDRLLYVVDQATRGLRVVDAQSGIVLGACDTGGNPFDVVVAPGGHEVYVSAERDATVNVIDVRDPSRPQVVSTLKVQKNPEGMAIRGDGQTLFVTNGDQDSVSVIDVARRKVERTLELRTINAQGYGTAPNGVAFSPDGRRAYVAQAVDDKVAVVDVESGTIVGAIPTAWYPTAVRTSPDGRRLYVAAAKGIGTEPGDDLNNRARAELIDIPSDAELAAYAARIDELNRRSNELFEVSAAAFRNPVPLERGGESPIEHVIVVVRENKTYDALLGDFPGGDGEPQNCLYCGDPTPNLRSLVERFASGDNYYSNAEDSDQGHQLMTGGLSTVFLEKTVHVEGRPVPTEADVVFNPAVYPKKEYLFQALVAKGIPFRVYGEAVGMWPGDLLLNGQYAHASIVDPPFFWQYSKDVDKLSGRIAEWEGAGLPPVVFMLLPNDHTLGCEAGMETPRSMVADNDLATGRFVDWLSHSKYWDSSMVIVVEDDPQQGRDHVDPHRSILLVASPWVKRGYVSKVLYHEGNLHATLEHLLGLEPRVVYDELAQPMWDMFTNTPDFTPFDEIPRRVPEEIALPGTNCGEASRGLDFLDPDRVAVLPEILWTHQKLETDPLHAEDGASLSLRWKRIIEEARRERTSER